MEKKEKTKAKNHDSETQQAKVQTETTPTVIHDDDLVLLRHEDFAESLDDLEKLLSQSKRVFLLGAGCSKCAGLPLMNELTEDVLSQLSEGAEHAILNGLKEHFKNSSSFTIEDLMSELVDWLSIAQRRKYRESGQQKITINNNEYKLSDLESTLAAIKQSVKECIGKPPTSIDTHRSFVRSVHGAQQAGKATQVYSVDYFILNYDTLLEDALAIEQVQFADGFSGGATGWWNSETYDDARFNTRVFKVHGSIDWCSIENDVFPRRLRPKLPSFDQQNPVLIWPAATKYRDAQSDPFALILQRMRFTLRSQLGSEVVLAICGYSFGDEHINIEIERALFESDQRLTVLVFSNEDRPSGRLNEWLKEERIRDQIRVYSKSGFFRGADESTLSRELPWWKFEVLTRLLEGQR